MFSTGNEIFDESGLPSGTSKKFWILLSEAQLTSQVLANGCSLISKILPERDGIYYQMLFDLSIGLERLCKIILMTDTLLNDQTLTEKQLKNYGHNISDLIKKVFEVAEKYPDSQLSIDFPDSEIHKNIIIELNNFANFSRYHNLTSLSQNSSDSINPIECWYKNVTVPILNAHYKRTLLSTQEEIMCDIMDNSTGGFSRTETGFSNSWQQVFEINKQLPYIHKYTRLYVMQIIRALGKFLFVLEDIAQSKSPPHGDIPYFTEVFPYLYLSDSCIKKRKKFSVYF